MKETNVEPITRQDLRVLSEQLSAINVKMDMVVDKVNGMKGGRPSKQPEIVRDPSIISETATHFIIKTQEGSRLVPKQSVINPSVPK